jgi:hypothetical protein
MSTLLKAYQHGILDVFTEKEFPCDGINTAHINIMKACMSASGREVLFIPDSVFGELEAYVSSVPDMERTGAGLELDRQTLMLLSTR